MEKNEIIIENKKVGYISQDGQILTRTNKDIFCGNCCKEHNLKPSNKNVKDMTTAKEIGAVFYINSDKTKIICKSCGREMEVTKTYEDYLEEEELRNKERLENLHIVLVGEDWECGFKFYGLSAQISYDDWLKVKKYFSYHRKGWSKGQELEWNFGEPTGWLTRNGFEVQNILFENGLIKSENLREFADWEKGL